MHNIYEYCLEGNHTSQLSVLSYQLIGLVRLCQLSDALFFREFADEQHVVFLGHDKAFETLYHHALLFGGVHNAVVRIVQRHIEPMTLLP